MKAVLNPELADRYEIVGEHRDRVATSYGTIHFSTLSAKYADALIAKGCPFIRRKEELPVENDSFTEAPIVEVPLMRTRRKSPIGPGEDIVEHPVSE